MNILFWILKMIVVVIMYKYIVVILIEIWVNIILFILNEKNNIILNDMYLIYFLPKTIMIGHLFTALKD